MQTFSYIDLFAGCGGMSLGLQMAGFRHVLGVERSAMAAETYFRNIVLKRGLEEDEWQKHRHSDPERQIECGLYVGQIEDLLSNTVAIGRLIKEGVDVVAGGPPCQGFSTVGKRNPDDIRNTLPYRFFDFIEKVKPKAFIMENVIGISLDFKKHEQETPLDLICKSFLEEGYHILRTQLNAMHYGVPQHRPRIFIIGLRKDIAQSFTLSEADHHYQEKIWRSKYRCELTDVPLLAPKPSVISKSTVVTVGKALADIGDSGYKYNCDDDKYKNNNYISQMRDGCSSLQNHALRKHTEPIVAKFEFFHKLNRLMACPDGNPDVSIGRGLKDINILSRVANFIKGRGIYIQLCDGTIINDEGSFRAAVERFSTRKHSQQVLDAKKVSPTLVTIPDDYIHHRRPRVLTVREMARIQSFPDNFIFQSKVTTGGAMRKVEVPQYSQVGNAVPPLLAQAIASRLLDLLKRSATKEANL